MTTHVTTSCEQCCKVIPTAEPAHIIAGRVVCRGCRDRGEPACPYCGSVMQRKLPKNHGKCPDCAETFFLRPDQAYFDSTILTREQKEFVAQVRWREQWAQEHGASAADCARVQSLGRGQRWDVARYESEYQALAARAHVASMPGVFESLGTVGVLALIEAWGTLRVRAGGWVGETEPFGFPRSRFVEVCLELRARFGRPAAKGDIVWACLVERAARPTDLNDLHRLQWAQADFLRNEGRDARHILREVFRTECRRWVEGSVPAIEVDAEYGCPAGKRLHGRRFPLAAAIARPPVPCDDCTGQWDGGEHGPVPWCECNIRPVFEGE